MTGVFISYRREDSAGHVGRLYDALSDRFGGDRVFMDIDHIQAGQDFVDVLNRAVANCKAVLVVIGPHWLSASGKNGRRLDDPADFVRLEIAAALRRGVHVIPVLVHGATMPAPADLPVDLTGLARHQAVEIADNRWKRDVQVLIDSLEPLLPNSSKLPRPKSMALWIASAVAALAVGGVLFVRFAPRDMPRTADEAVETEVPLIKDAVVPPIKDPAVPLTQDAAAPPNRSAVVPPNKDAAVPTRRDAASDSPPPGRVLFDDDFYTNQRLRTAQTRYQAAPSFCRTEYVADGFLVEAVSNGSCEYVLYDAPFMPNRIRIEVSMRLRRFPQELLKTGDHSEYGVRFIEAMPADPDTPLAYRAAIVRVDDFNVVEWKWYTAKVLLRPKAENYISAGERGTNTLAVEVDGRSLKWALNTVPIGSITTQEPLSGAISTFIEGKGLQVVFKSLRIVDIGR